MQQRRVQLDPRGATAHPPALSCSKLDTVAAERSTTLDPADLEQQSSALDASLASRSSLFVASGSGRTARPYAARLSTRAPAHGKTLPGLKGAGTRPRTTPERRRHSGGTSRDGDSPSLSGWSRGSRRRSGGAASEASAGAACLPANSLSKDGDNRQPYVLEEASESVSLPHMTFAKAFQSVVGVRGDRRVPDDAVAALAPGAAGKVVRDALLELNARHDDAPPARHVSGGRAKTTPPELPISPIALHSNDGFRNMAFLDSAIKPTLGMPGPLDYKPAPLPTSPAARWGQAAPPTMLEVIISKARYTPGPGNYNNQGPPPRRVLGGRF